MCWSNECTEASKVVGQTSFLNQWETLPSSSAVVSKEGILGRYDVGPIGVGNLEDW